MPPERRAVSIVVFSGDFERVHYALVMAAAAAATDAPTHLFFTMRASRALLRADADGPGWRALAVAETDLGAHDALARDALFGARGVARFEELLTSAAELGTRFMVCEMGLRALGIERSALRDDIAIEDGGVVTFLARAEGATFFV